MKSKDSLKCSQTRLAYDHADDRYGLGEPNFSAADSVKVVLTEPNIAEYTDAKGETKRGTWTMIYDEGFEVRVDGHKYFAFSYYQQASDFLCSSRSLVD